MTFAVSWAFMTGSDSQAVDTESSKAPGLTYRFQGSMNVHHGTGVSAAVTVSSAYQNIILLHPYKFLYI